MGSFLSF